MNLLHDTIKDYNEAIWLDSKQSLLYLKRGNHDLLKFRECVQTSKWNR